MILSAILVTMTQRMIVKTISGRVLPTIMSTFIRKRYAAKPASHTMMLHMSTALLALSFLRMKKSAYFNGCFPLPLQPDGKPGTKHSQKYGTVKSDTGMGLAYFLGKNKEKALDFPYEL